MFDCDLEQLLYFMYKHCIVEGYLILWLLFGQIEVLWSYCWWTKYLFSMSYNFDWFW